MTTTNLTALKAELENATQRIEALTNVGARLAACLWDFHGVCPECGNTNGSHMPDCRQIYAKEFKGPKDTFKAFESAFGGTP